MSVNNNRSDKFDRNSLLNAFGKAFPCAVKDARGGVKGFWRGNLIGIIEDFNPHKGRSGMGHIVTSKFHFEDLPLKDNGLEEPEFMGEGITDSSWLQAGTWVVFNRVGYLGGKAGNIRLLKLTRENINLILEYIQHAPRIEGRTFYTHREYSASVIESLQSKVNEFEEIKLFGRTLCEFLSHKTENDRADILKRWLLLPFLADKFRRYIESHHAMDEKWHNIVCNVRQIMGSRVGDGENTVEVSAFDDCTKESLLLRKESRMKTQDIRHLFNGQLYKKAADSFLQTLEVIAKPRR